MNKKLEDFCLNFSAGHHLAGGGTIAEQLSELETSVDNDAEWLGTAYGPYEHYEPDALLNEIYGTCTNLKYWLGGSGLLKESHESNQELVLTRRLYASHALQAVLSTVTVVGDVTPTWAAEKAFQIANAMMEEEKKQETLYGS